VYSESLLNRSDGSEKIRVLNPLLKVFNLAPNRIKMHNEVSDNEDLTCPGDFLDRAVVEAMVRRFVIK